MQKIAIETDTVTIHYRASTRDGGVIEDTSGRKPLVMNLADEHFLPLFRKQIIGMQPGQEKTIKLDPHESFGLRDHLRQMTVPRGCLPSGIQKGDQLSTTIQGYAVNAWVVQLGEEEATLDTNHPLAGEPLELSVQMISIEA